MFKWIIIVNVYFVFFSFGGVIIVVEELVLWFQKVYDWVVFVFIVFNDLFVLFYVWRCYWVKGLDIFVVNYLYNVSSKDSYCNL